MKAYWRAAAAVLALAAALTLGALLPATPGHTQVARQVVRVLQNGPTDAVPVTLQGTGAVNGNVSVVNTPTVNLAPGTILPVEVDSGEPVQLLLDFSTTFLGETRNVLTVPPGKRFVLEDLSGIALVPTGQKVLLAAISLGPNTSVNVPPVFTGPFSQTQDMFVWGRLARAYGNPGAIVGLGGSRSAEVGTATFRFAASGHFTDL